MSKVLILFAHPTFERSRINKALVEQIRKKEGITFHDLYERYPDFNVDAIIEKKLLSEHDAIVWHHPFYWYSCPPLLKQWIDIVLEYNWAYGPKGNALKGKQCMNVITTGGSREVYCSSGSNNYSINEFLRPFEQTARLCGMEYLPPFSVMGTHKLSAEEIQKYCDQYEHALELLVEGISAKKLRQFEHLNDSPELENPTQ